VIAKVLFPTPAMPAIQLILGRILKVQTPSTDEAGFKKNPMHI